MAARKSGEKKRPAARRKRKAPASRPKRPNTKAGETKRTAKVEAAVLKSPCEIRRLKLAADVAGIHRDTLLNWRKADAEFAQACGTAPARSTAE